MALRLKLARYRLTMALRLNPRPATRCRAS